MSDAPDRRAQDRLEIDGGKVYYKMSFASDLFGRYQGPLDLIDISKSGSGFIAYPPIYNNDGIKIKVKFPGEKALNLKAKVMWTAENQDGKTIRIGVMFMPFGSRREYNPPGNLARLNKLNEKYN